MWERGSPLFIILDNAAFFQFRQRLVPPNENWNLVPPNENWNGKV